MNKRKSISVIIALMMILTACGNTDETEDITDISLSESITVTASEETATESESDSETEETTSEQTETSDSKTAVTSGKSASSVSENTIENIVSEATETTTEEVTTTTAVSTTASQTSKTSQTTTAVTTVTTKNEVTSEKNEVTTQTQASGKKVKISIDSYTDYFSDSLFIGDSICSGLKIYGGLLRTENCAARINVSTWGIDKYKFQYKTNSTAETDIDSIVSLYKPKDIYIWMGMNDLYVVNTEKFADNMKNLALRFIKLSPESKIHVVSITPMAKWHNWNTELDGNNRINIYNSYCEQSFEKEPYIDFINVHDCLIDEYGYLASENDGGDGLHLSFAAYKKVLNEIVKYNYMMQREEEKEEENEETSSAETTVSEKVTTESVTTASEGEGIDIEYIETEYVETEATTTVETTAPEMPEGEFLPVV